MVRYASASDGASRVRRQAGISRLVLAADSVSGSTAGVWSIGVRLGKDMADRRRNFVYPKLRIRVRETSPASLRHRAITIAADPSDG
jgi:hypothetical protein